MSSFTSLVVLALVLLFCCSIMWSLMDILNAEVSWIFEPLIKVSPDWTKRFTHVRESHLAAVIGYQNRPFNNCWLVT